MKRIIKNRKIIYGIILFVIAAYNLISVYALDKYNNSRDLKIIGFSCIIIGIIVMYFAITERKKENG